MTFSPKKKSVIHPLAKIMRCEFNLEIFRSILKSEWCQLAFIAHINHSKGEITEASHSFQLLLLLSCSDNFVDFDTCSCPPTVKDTSLSYSSEGIRDTRPSLSVNYLHVLLGIISLLENFQDSRYYEHWINLEKGIETLNSVYVLSTESFHDNIIIRMMATEEVRAEVLEISRKSTMYDILTHILNKMEVPFVEIGLSIHQSRCTLLSAHKDFSSLSDFGYDMTKAIGGCMDSFIPRKNYAESRHIKDVLCGGVRVRRNVTVLSHSKEHIPVSIAAVPMFDVRGYVDRALVFVMPSASPSFGMSSMKYISNLLDCVPPFLLSPHKTNKRGVFGWQS